RTRLWRAWTPLCRCRKSGRFSAYQSAKPVRLSTIRRRLPMTAVQVSAFATESRERTRDEPVEAALKGGAPTNVESVRRRHNEGHGRRLTAAFEALEAFPALAESRDRILRVVRDDRASAGDLVAAVESDVALVIAVL